MKIKTRALSGREKIILAVTAAVLSSVLFFDFVVVPLGTRIGRMEKEISRNEVLLGRYMRLLDKKEDILSLYNSHKDILDEGVGREEVSSVLFRDVRNTAKDFGLALRQVKPLPVKTDERSNRVSLDAEFDGSFDAIVGFVDRLEKIGPFVRVSGMRIFHNKSGRASDLSCRIVVSRIFFRRLSNAKEREGL